jgi:hypothetical protein
MTDRRTVLAVVALVGGVTLVGVVAVAALALLERPIPDALVQLASTALGGLIALLVSTRSDPPT